MIPEIRDWLSKQYPWIQEAAFRLLTNGEISDSEISDLVAIIKTPSEAPAKYEYPTIGAVYNDQRLRLCSIGPIEGIDALNPRTPLPLVGENLVVIYGDNGSGKTGYVRILKKASGKPSSTELRSDVFQANPTIQQCTFSFKLEDEHKEITWQAKADPEDQLRAIDIFDSKSGAVYLKGETDLSYSPPELVLFSDLVDTCKRLEEALKNEQATLISKLPKNPQALESTKWIVHYKRLRHDITDTQFDTFTAWNSENEKQLTVLSKRLETADPAAKSKKKLAIKRQLGNMLAELKSARAALATESIDKLKALKTAAIQKRKTAEDGAKAATASAKLDAIGGETWRALWEAARSYSLESAYPEESFPKTDDDSRCVLCHQMLKPDAKQRLIDFEGYVSGLLETEAKKAEEELDSALEAIPQVPEEATISTAAQAADLSDGKKEELVVLWTKIRTVAAQLAEKNFDAERPNISEIAEALELHFQELAGAAETAATQLEKDAKQFDRAKVESEKLELDARKWVSEQKTAIEQEILRLKRLEMFKLWIGSTSTRGISLKAGELSKSLITDAYIARFNNELEKLGANHIRVELVKTGTQQGRSKHQIKLKDLQQAGARPAEILSDGEHRVVALAAFFADVTGKNSKAPFVFDDPITSLAQRFEEKTVSRLIELSSDRQVLVFTHRLSLLGLLSDQAGSNIEIIHIRKQPWGTGEIADMPLFGKRPDRALNALKNGRLAQAKTSLEEIGYDEYYPLAKSICSDFRILLERIVELTLLADVVQRHRRAINTVGKLAKLSKISDSDCTLIDKFMTKYSRYEHSQSDEAPVQVPEPSELLDDIQEVITWHEEFKSR